MVEKLSPPPNVLMRKFINHAANQLHAFLWGEIIGKNKTLSIERYVRQITLCNMHAAKHTHKVYPPFIKFHS